MKKTRFISTINNKVKKDRDTVLVKVITSDGILIENKCPLDSWDNIQLLIDEDKCKDRFSTFICWDDDGNDNDKALYLGVKGTEFN